MKRFEKFAIVLIVLWILTVIPNPLISIVLARISGPVQFENMNATQVSLVFARGVLTVIVQIAVGIWLFGTAKRDKFSPWVWSLFGFLFGITAIVLYYVMQLAEELKVKRQIIACRGREKDRAADV